jgi:hypothetical protein
MLIVDAPYITSSLTEQSAQLVSQEDREENHTLAASGGYQVSKFELY